jgi:ABC-type Fe3+-hydroxamate transport system substrate-binding protein
MPIFIDQTGRSVKLMSKPQRIISLVPSQSEFLWDLGLSERLVGITKFCIHPEEMFRNVDRIGGTKSLHIDKIRKLKPDLIIGNKEENERKQIEELQNEFTVWMSDIFTIEDSLSMMREIGKITGKEVEAYEILEQVKNALTCVTNIFEGESVLYFIWKDPYMLAGKNTFIDTILSQVGLKNSVMHLQRYPELTNEELKRLKPKFCFLSSEPYPFKEKHVEEISKLLPETIVLVVDGELFSWYGSRLRGLPDYLKKLKEQINS